MKILSGNLLHAQCIVLAIRPCNPQQNNIKKGENSQRSQTNVQISQTQTFDKQNYPKSRPLRKIELTPSLRRITLLSIRNMLYESLKLFPRGPPGNTCASMGNLRKLGPKTLQMMRFSVNFSTSFRTPDVNLKSCRTPARSVRLS